MSGILLQHFYYFRVPRRHFVVRGKKKNKVNACNFLKQRTALPGHVSG
jgi:hypothetical protein